MSMMRLKPAYLLLGLLLNIASAQGQEVVEQDNWKVMPGTQSSDLAKMLLVTLISSAGHSWPDGRQAVVTFWRSGATYLRCIDYFEQDMTSSGGVCYQPIQE
jgi:hypothetical protein